MESYAAVRCGSDDRQQKHSTALHPEGILTRIEKGMSLQT
jgi:hypothetical protein